jgi:hypothetical protein
MKHLNIRWNPATKEWYCTACGRTSDHANVYDTHKALDQYECQIPSLEAARADPGTETVRLIKKQPQRSGSRFVVTKMDDGRPLIRLELHDTVLRLESLTVGFEVLSGVTLDQARTLVDAMNERIVGVIVTAK